MTKSLVTFTHGIGDFNPDVPSKVKLLQDINKFFTEYLGRKVDTAYLSYERLLDSKTSSIAVQTAAKLASRYYTGTPVIGQLVADYGGDILQYYLGRRTTRAKITDHIISQLEFAGRNLEEGDSLTIVGHSLGSLVVMRLMTLINFFTGPYIYNDTGERLDDRLYKEAIERGYDERLEFLQGVDVRCVLLGSPAFSKKLKLVRRVTNNLALAESPFIDLAEKYNERTEKQIINVYSDSFIRDPLAGPAPGPVINVNAGKIRHRDIVGHLNSLSDS